MAAASGWSNPLDHPLAVAAGGVGEGEGLRGGGRGGEGGGGGVGGAVVWGGGIFGTKSVVDVTGPGIWYHLTIIDRQKRGEFKRCRPNGEVEIF